MESCGESADCKTLKIDLKSLEDPFIIGTSSAFLQVLLKHCIAKLCVLTEKKFVRKLNDTCSWLKFLDVHNV